MCSQSVGVRSQREPLRSAHFGEWFAALDYRIHGNEVLIEKYVYKPGTRSYKRARDVLGEHFALHGQCLPRSLPNEAALELSGLAVVARIRSLRLTPVGQTLAE